MVVASKKTIEKAQEAGCLFSVKNSDIIECGEFGSFEVIKTKRGIMFKTYTGFHVWTTPYAVGTDGKAHETSLYSWLNELLAMSKNFKGHEDEPLVDESSSTKGDLLEAAKIVTQANLTRPTAVFTDRDYAFDEANRYMNWLAEQMQLLQKVSSETPPEEDEKANAEFNAKIEAASIMQQMMDSETQGDNHAGESK